MPAKQWRCFHCDQVFTSPKSAREHFGLDQFQTPACRLTQPEGHLVGYIRELESQLEEYRRESHATLVAAYGYHLDALSSARKAEEKGYDKGVSDTWPMRQALRTAIWRYFCDVPATEWHPEKLDSIVESADPEARLEEIMAERRKSWEPTNV